MNNTITLLGFILISIASLLFGISSQQEIQTSTILIKKIIRVKEIKRNISVYSISKSMGILENKLRRKMPERKIDKLVLRSI